MRPIPHRFQEAISKAKAEGARTLSLRGDGKKDDDNVLFEVSEAVFSLEGLDDTFAEVEASTKTLKKQKRPRPSKMNRQ